MYAPLYGTRGPQAAVHQSVHDQKLKRLAARSKCSEAAIVRAALDRMPDVELTPKEQLVARLRAVGLLVESPDEDAPSLNDDALRTLERETDEWFRTHPPIRLGEAVLEDRAER